MNIAVIHPGTWKPGPGYISGFAAVFISLIAAASWLLPPDARWVLWTATGAAIVLVIPLIWREGYTWIILWIAPIAAFDLVPTDGLRVAKYAVVLLAILIPLLKRRLAPQTVIAVDLKPLWPAIALVAWIWIRALTGSAPLAGAFEALRLSMVAAVVYLWLSESGRNGGRRRWYAIWMSMGLFQVAACLVEAMVYGRLRSYGTFPNANALGAYLFMAIAIALAVAIAAPRRRERVVSHFILTALLFALYLTGSRASWVATLIAAITITITLKSWRFAIVGLAGVCMSAYLYASNPLVHFAVDSALRLETGMTHRPIIWEAADRARERVPIWGFGPKAVGEEIAREASYPSPIHRNIIADMVLQGSVHNFYRKLHLETGYIGVAIFVCMVTMLLFRSWRGRGSPDPWRRIYSITLFGVILGVIAHSYFENSVFLGSMSAAIFFWFLVAQSLRSEDPRYRISS